MQESRGFCLCLRQEFVSLVAINMWIYCLRWSSPALMVQDASLRIRLDQQAQFTTCIKCPNMTHDGIIHIDVLQ